VTICDINAQRVGELCKQHGFASVDDANHLALACDVYAPCARGATVNDETIPQIKARAIAGCANNQLLEPRHADVLRERGIVYAPDYVINAGGIINVGIELIPGGYDEAKALEKVDRIYGILKQVFQLAREQKISTAAASQKLAEQRLAAGRRAKAAVR
jgi:leucine dehydrogenase